MIIYLLAGILPTDQSYKFLATPNGTMRAWYREDSAWVPETPFPSRSWPDVEVGHVRSCLGDVATTRHLSSWSPYNTGIVVVPGYFGSSRHGPYGLYTRLASAWAKEGYETVTLDPLGSGDSTPIVRTFESEVASVEAVARQLLEVKDSLILVGHSMGGATALAAREKIGPADCLVWCLAPLCKLADLAHGFLSEEGARELDHYGRTFRHGLELRLEMIAHAEDAWNRLHAGVDGVWTGAADRYTATVDLSALSPRLVRQVPGADHNFSNDTGVASLTESTLEELDRLSTIEEATDGHRI